ncbi:MAG: hypothetical protein JO165_09180 [Candidatus Eremiobacteraeota bacterium]|nr:hypothetical protein [Candidatus Eremiobacteraeota bacterium]
MSDPSKRFLTLVMVLGIIVLIGAIALGERMGDRVIGQVTEKRLEGVAPITVSPAPASQSAQSYGPNWRQTQVLAAASDPGFPDPRVPPVPLPTPMPLPKNTPAPARSAVRPTPTPTPNMNLPIWRRAQPLPTVTPEASASPEPTGSASPSASPKPTGEPDNPG